MLVSIWFGLVVIRAAFGADPTPCCFDKQYSVTVGDVGEVLTDNLDSVSFIDGYSKVGYDYYRDRMGSVSYMRQPDGSVQQKYELRDYVTRRMYTSIDNGTCTYTDLVAYDQLRAPCIPDNATYIGSSVFGYGAQSLKVHTWKFMFNLENEPNEIYISVTQDHCVLVTETYIGNYQGSRTEQSFFFYDYHPGIENVNRLDTPTGCTESTTTPASGR